MQAVQLACVTAHQGVRGGGGGLVYPKLRLSSQGPLRRLASIFHITETFDFV